MIALINASAFRSDEGSSSLLTSEECREYLASYAGSKVRLWAYHASLSRLVLRIERPTDKALQPIDLVFVSVSEIRCPVHWTLGVIEIRQASELKAVFVVASADVAVSASNLTIVVQDEYPQKLWELDSGRGV